MIKILRPLIEKTTWLRLLSYIGKKLVILGAFGFIAFTLFLIVKSNQVDIPPREPYDKTGFVEAAVYRQTVGSQTVMENDTFRMTLSNTTTLFDVFDKVTGTIWRSNPNTTTRRFLEPFIIYYVGSLGQDTAFGVYENAVLFDDFKVRVLNDSSIEILYEVGGKKDIDQFDFPTIITDERMQDLILSKLTPGTTDYRRVTDQAYVFGTVNGVDIWKLKEGIQVSILRQLYRIFYDVAGYTTEELRFDQESNGILVEDRYPYFEFSVIYTLTNQGLKVDIPNAAFVEKEKYRLAYIDVLPFFGAGSTTDVGYSLIPDGSGALIDFNTDRAFALPYMQRIYGGDQAIIQSILSPTRQGIRFGVFGMKVRDEAFIAILNQGSSMSAIRSRIASVDQPYNQTFYRFYLRESQPFQFASISSSVTIIEWTPWSTTTNFSLEYQFIQTEPKDYAGMARMYQRHLLNQGILHHKDQTSQLAVDLTILGGYINKENFFGIPYEPIRALTSTAEAKKIIDQFLAINDVHLNVIYRGFSNDGLKPTRYNRIRFQQAIGTAADFQALNAYFKSKQVILYPEVHVSSAYTNKHINEEMDVVRDVFYKVVKNYAFNPATLTIDSRTRPRYTLHPKGYLETLTTIQSSLARLGMEQVAILDAARFLTGTYLKKDTLFRSDTEQLLIEALASIYPQTKLLLRQPNLFTLPYATSVTDVSLEATPYQIISTSVPFVALVLSGTIDFSYSSLNLYDRYPFEWHELKMLETAANLSLTWSYHSTIHLVGTEYSEYFSTHYEAWFDRVSQLIARLNDSGVYQTHMIHHMFINAERSASKTTYANGMEMVFNYSTQTIPYEQWLIPAMSAIRVREAQS